MVLGWDTNHGTGLGYPPWSWSLLPPMVPGLCSPLMVPLSAPRPWSLSLLPDVPLSAPDVPLSAPDVPLSERKVPNVRKRPKDTRMVNELNHFVSFDRFDKTRECQESGNKPGNLRELKTFNEKRPINQGTLSFASRD